MPTGKSNKQVNIDDILQGEIMIYGSSDGGTTFYPVTVDTSGHLQIDVLTPGGLSIPVHDYIAITYVVAGNGVGEIETVVYKTGGSGGTTVATLTLAYDANNKLSSVTES